jgi:ATP-binding cassette, subfamily B, bacterial CvaB/MchF/RaxB
VMQDDQLLAGSIADNISFFNAEPDMDRMELAAKQAAIHTDIAKMPMQYRTLVGDMGTTLSGGQKQRVMLARAIYHQPKILVLDEATSHLDNQNELLVINALKGLKMTMINVAHRQETITMANRVVVLAGGKVAKDMRKHTTAERQPAAALESA